MASCDIKGRNKHWSKNKACTIESWSTEIKDKFDTERGQLKAYKGQKIALMHTQGKYNREHSQLKACKGQKRALRNKKKKTNSTEKVAH